MSTDIRVVAPVQPEVQALSKICQDLAEQSSLERFEIVVKSRLAQGVNDDNDLRITDDLLHQVVLGGDAVEAATKPVTSQAFATHKALVGVANAWKGRWSTLADALKGAMLRYKRAKEELAARQQRELELAAAAERKRKEDEARAALRNGDMATAKAAMQEAQAIVTPVIMDATPVLDNSSARKVWEVQVTNPEALIKAVASGAVPISVVKEFDLGFLKREATKRGGLNWPGVAARQTDALSVRR